MVRVFGYDTYSTPTAWLFVKMVRVFGYVTYSTPTSWLFVKICKGILDEVSP